MSDVTGFQRQRRIAEQKKAEAEKKAKLDPGLMALTKKQLEAYALENFEVDLDLRQNKETLVAQVMELEAKKAEEE